MSVPFAKLDLDVSTSIPLNRKELEANYRGRSFQVDQKMVDASAF